MGTKQSTVQKNDKNINSSDNNTDSSQSSFDPYNNNSSGQDFTDPWDKGSNDSKNQIDVFSPISASDVSTKDIGELSEGNVMVEEGLVDNKKEKLKKDVEQFIKKYRCEIFGFSNLMVGSAAGAVLGAVQGVATNSQHFGKYGFAKVVATASGSSALNFGLWLGCFSYTKCQLITFRKKDDLYNTFGGAFTAGALSSFRTRSPTQIVINRLIRMLIVIL